MTAVASSMLDCRGLPSPMPTVKLAKAIRTVTIGGVIDVFATDPKIVEDMDVFERETGHRVVERVERSGVYRFRVQRTR